LFDATATYWDYARAQLSYVELAALQSAGERIKEDLHVIGESGEEFGVIHRDLQSSNVVFDEGVPYIIDFDHCGWGHYMYDLALPYLHLERLGERCSMMREALMEGYLSRRALRDDYRASLETFVHMHVMNKLIRTVVKFPDRASELQEGVARLARFASTPRTL
jgi:Ser/Thr protein kinase RdoA (MazF antagonist)